MDSPHAAHLLSAPDRVQPLERDAPLDVEASHHQAGPEWHPSRFVHHHHARLVRSAMQASVDSWYRIHCSTGWDDPRLATIVGLRRRGFTPEILKDFCTRVGISRNNNVISLSYLELCARDFLNVNAPRALAVIDPIRVTCTNFPGMLRTGCMKPSALWWRSGLILGRSWSLAVDQRERCSNTRCRTSRRRPSEARTRSSSRGSSTLTARTSASRTRPTFIA